MAYNIGEEVLYKTYTAQIFRRKIDYPKGWIDTAHSKGNFDYLIEYEDKEGFKVIKFANEHELTLIAPND